jgi:hypothetical protein
MAPVSIPPRVLTRPERDVLDFMLSRDFPGAEQLRAQVPSARVIAVWVEGLPSVDLEVPATVDRAPVADGPIPNGSEVRDDAGEYVGEVIVWATDGYLSAIEYAWVTDDPPTSLPDVTRMTLV